MGILSGGTFLSFIRQLVFICTSVCGYRQEWIDQFGLTISLGQSGHIRQQSCQDCSGRHHIEMSQAYLLSNFRQLSIGQGPLCAKHGASDGGPAAHRLPGQRFETSRQESIDAILGMNKKLQILVYYVKTKKVSTITV